jgi:magnesium transporter
LLNHTQYLLTPEIQKTAMSKLSSKIGKHPGSLIYVGKFAAKNTHIQIIEYNKTDIQEEVVTDVQALKNTDSKVTWLNVCGLANTEIIQRIGDVFKIHPLTLEDVLNTQQRPMFEEFEDYMFVSLKMIQYENQKIITEHISLVLGEGYVISFQETKGDIWDFIRTRLRDNKGKIRGEKSDYLLYRLLDAVVEHYFLVIEKLSDDIEQLEERVVKKSDIDTMNVIRKTKKQLAYLKRAVWPLREVINSIIRSESTLIQSDRATYFRDIHTHCIQVADTVETLRENISGIMDMYMSVINTRMNEIMKTLTIFAAIFIPLTFFAGVYGMNFTNFPELDWEYAYPAFWIGCLAVVLGMYVYFKKMKWM